METNVVSKEMATRSERINPLGAIKLLHTLVWAIMAEKHPGASGNGAARTVQRRDDFDRDHSRRVQFGEVRAKTGNNAGNKLGTEHRRKGRTAVNRHYLNR
jgi:hypothetical protein